MKARSNYTSCTFFHVILFKNDFYLYLLEYTVKVVLDFIPIKQKSSLYFVEFDSLSPLVLFLLDHVLKHLDLIAYEVALLFTLNQVS